MNKEKEPIICECCGEELLPHSPINIPIDKRLFLGEGEKIMKLKSGRSYRCKLLKPYSHYEEHPKGEILILKNWHCNQTPECREDWWNKLVVCNGHGDFSVFEPNVDIEIIEEMPLAIEDTKR